MAQLLVREREDDVAAGLRTHVRNHLTGPKKPGFTDALAAMPYLDDDPAGLFEA